MTDTRLDDLKASDIMTTPVITVNADATIASAVTLMLEQGVSGLPVLDPQGALVGMMTEGDLLRRSEIGTGKTRPRWIALFLMPAELADEYVRENAQRVADVMTRAPLATAAGETPLKEIVRLMEAHQVKRIPVVDDRQLLGIVSRADLLDALHARLAAAAGRKAPDKVIRRKLRHALHEMRFLNEHPKIAVNGGVVDLFWSLDSSDWERQAARVAVEKIPGVKEVHERFLVRS